MLPTGGGMEINMLGIKEIMEIIPHRAPWDIRRSVMVSLFF